MKKKILCIVLSISMLAVFMPSVAFADPTYDPEVAIPVNNFLELYDIIDEGFDCSIALTGDITLPDGGPEGPLFVIADGQDIYLDLNGHTINGYDECQLFAVLSDSSLVLVDGTLTHGYSALSGGAIFVDEGAEVSLKDMTINNCYAQYSGGAVYVLGKLNLEGKVVIKENIAGHDGLPSKDNVSVDDGWLYIYNLSSKSEIGLTDPDYNSDYFAFISQQNDIKYLFSDDVYGGIGYQISPTPPAFSVGKSLVYELHISDAYYVACQNAHTDLIDAIALDVVNYPTQAIENLVKAYNERVMKEINTCGTVEKVAELVAKAKAQDAVIAAGGTGATVAALAAYNYVDKAFVVPYQQTLTKLYDYAFDGNLIAQKTIDNLDCYLKNTVPVGFTVTPGEAVVGVVAAVAKQIVAYNTDMVAMNTALQQIQGQEAVKFTFQAIGRVVYSVREGVYEFFRTIFNNPKKA